MSPVSSSEETAARRSPLGFAERADRAWLPLAASVHALLCFIRKDCARPKARSPGSHRPRWNPKTSRASSKLSVVPRWQGSSSRKAPSPREPDKITIMQSRGYGVPGNETPFSIAPMDLSAGAFPRGDCVCSCLSVAAHKHMYTLSAAVPHASRWRLNRSLTQPKAKRARPTMRRRRRKAIGDDRALNVHGRVVD